jgi:hypothetical protein
MFHESSDLISQGGQEEALWVLLYASSNSQFREAADKNGACLVLANFRSEAHEFACALIASPRHALSARMLFMDGFSHQGYLY